MKANIVTLERDTNGYGRTRPPVTVYAIRRKKRHGFLFLQSTYEYLRLRDLDKPEWRKRDTGSGSSFWDIYTVDNPEAILEKWNFTPKSKEELERERFGTVVNAKTLLADAADAEEEQENASRIDRLGVDTDNVTQRQEQRGRTTGRHGIRI